MMMKEYECFCGEKKRSYMRSYISSKLKRQLVNGSKENCSGQRFSSGWWFGTCFIFHNIWDVIIPIDELIFFKMVIAPPTSC